LHAACVAYLVLRRVECGPARKAPVDA